MKTLAEIRDELAKQQGDNHTHPELRSMYPQASRGAMSRQFAHIYTLGFDAGAKAVMEQTQTLVEALKSYSKYESVMINGDGPRCCNQLVLVPDFGIKAKEAIREFKEWQEFVGRVKE